MEKKSKLAIKHYYGKELEKIGKSPTGFPLYVMVRYKNIKTKYASRLGIRYASEVVGNEENLRHYPDQANLVIKEEVKHIEMVREYLEDYLEIEFKPSILVNNLLEHIYLEKVVGFFDAKPKQYSYSIETVLRERSSDLVDLYRVSGPMRFMSGVLHLDKSLFENLMDISDTRVYYNYYQLFKSVSSVELNRLQFRLEKIQGDDQLKEFKIWMDKKFDEEVKGALLSVSS
ncbi:hypothetical protein [Anditalea andensis]|uniref:Uncharacterized protein n=1 Tax=Anditalea andensis TaxID=1048983 RepID=A0A074KVG7_9BACT|nr:hypothetical protein [Anditalea andensis]KEO72934.1 hypothetical protein EL17_15035 [Anditalea andensis]